MEGQDTLNITVLIAGRPYPLRIKAGDEHTIRKIVKDVNEKINKFQLTYIKKDKQDCLAMTLLTYAVDFHKAQTDKEMTPGADLSDKIHQLDGLLDSFLG
ncbi:MAG: cell division protein ZapA [Saprospiraceae bacterium]|jgi:cell division protein ZapA (FtsZ GTPase activity inhibitor)|nr:cell division protein ZapA [Saprospiraceae bacterium]MDC3253285.1 cell division protein ZapA [bacterium]MDG1433426.1 cell division protein ZapA [Saprospiraceae bacterium]MDG2419831.1 cell division protein ZapA [Saprospiraceae bacterium]